MPCHKHKGMAPPLSKVVKVRRPARHLQARSWESCCGQDGTSVHSSDLRQLLSSPSAHPLVSVVGILLG